VIAVLLFHAGIAGFRGGYVGVDVFFVISGYLITQLLMSAQAGALQFADPKKLLCPGRLVPLQGARPVIVF
jgi:peptidoglycan/LPS O-acetylase OafA/YrhL